MSMFRTLTSAAMAVTLVAAGTTVSVAGQDARALFQRALVAERAGDDLDAAAALYQQVVRESGSDRELAARALLQLAGIEERQGRAGARQSYEAIAVGFADQVEVAALASARADALDAAAALAPSADTAGGPVKRPFSLWAGVMSPNGRYVATANPNEPDRWRDLGYYGLFVRDLQTGSVRQLDGQDYSQETRPRLGVYQDFVWSPDSTRIVYWRRVNIEPGATGRRHEIRIAKIDGSTPRVLVPTTESAIWPLDWSADGRQILASLRNNVVEARRQPELGLISVADGSIRRLNASSGHGLGYCWSASGLSPDGQLAAYSLGARLAYELPEGPQAAVDCDVYVAPVDGGEERPLIASPYHDQFVAWTPRGNLLFLSDRGGTMDLWLAMVNAGQVVGLPTRVARDVGHLYTMGFTQQGALYFLGPGHQRPINPGGSVLNPYENDVVQAELDPASGRLVGPAMPVSPSHPGRNHSPSWSADGKFLAYRTRHPRAMVWNGISVLSLETGEERQVVPQITASLAQQQVFVEPGGRTAIAATQAPHSTLYRIDLDTGAATELGPIGAEMVLAPDARSVAYIALPDRRAVVVRNLIDGQERTVFEAPEEARVSSLAISADGVQFTIRQNTRDETRILVGPMTGGEAHEVYRSTGVGVNQKSTWSPDGRYIYFIEKPEQNVTAEALFRVPVGGGPAEPMGLETDGTTIWNLGIDPSGRVITFSTELFGDPQEWVLDNFLPAHELVPRPVRR